MFKGEIKCKIFNFLTANSSKSYTQKQIFFSLKLDSTDNAVFIKVINESIASGLIITVGQRKIKVAEDIKCGYTQVIKKDVFYVYINKEKYLITTPNIENVFHGDLVLVRISDRYKLEAEYLTILKHKGSKIRGTIMDGGSFSFLIPDDDKKYPTDIFISKNDSEIPVEQYDRAIVQINQFDINGRPRGKVLYKLSNSEIIDDPFQMIVEKYKIEKDFSSDVKKKASSIKDAVSQSNYLRKIDLKDEPIFTIDGIGCKDLDDAISIKKFGDNYELGVYIADVSNYVEEGTPLDKAAFNRGTSYYFIDKVIPMLPVELSNGVCSLTPGKPRCCLGMKIIIDGNGGILDKEFFECVISSKNKFSYEEINAYLDGNNPEFTSVHKDLLPNIEYGLELSRILANKRNQRNAMIFDFDSMDFEIDVDGGVKKVFPNERGPANKMIEEFMILANETVAEVFENNGFPFLFRIHDNPFEERLEGFLDVCRAYGLKVDDALGAAQLHDLIKSIKDENLRRGLSMNLITTMKQAKYSSENIGHFGLASAAYCHFTSPIRRYPDLYNHRLLKRYIRKTLNNDELREYTAKTIEKVASHCCYTERNASKAEDEYDKYKSLEFFLDNSSNEYNGLIYSISSRGLYILIDNCVPGFIRVKNISYDDKRYVADINGTEYHIGDNINVFFSEFDAKDKRLLFSMVTEEDKTDES